MYEESGVEGEEWIRRRDVEEKMGRSSSRERRTKSQRRKEMEMRSSYQRYNFPTESDERYNHLWSNQDKTFMELQGLLMNLDNFAQENRYLRKNNAELDGLTTYPLPLG